MGEALRKAVAALAVLPVVTACGKKDAAEVAPAASALSASTAGASGTGAAVWHYVVAPDGASHIDMPGLAEHILADTTAAAGTLDVVPGDLAQCRGLVRVDLTTLSTATFHDGRDAEQTKHARTWLEAVVQGNTNEPMRWAEYAIRSVDGLSATDLAKVPIAKDGADDVRKVTATVHGELLVHGHKIPKDDPVAVTFRYPSGAARDAKPARVEIVSTQPMRVVLKEHEVGPRDPAGQALAWTTKLISKVAETADVTVNIAAVPGP